MDTGSSNEVDAGTRGPVVEADTEAGVPMATLVELHQEIDARMHQGDLFSSIEDEVIEPSGLSDDQKSALWLYGWSFVDSRAQRREARAHLAQLVGDSDTR
jgi:hypothetical protein